MFESVDVECRLALAPYYASSTRIDEGITQAFASMLMRFVPALGGTPVAFSDVKLRERRLRMTPDTGETHLWVPAAARLVLFKPQTDCLVEAVVHKIALDHVTFLVAGVFPLVVPQHALEGAFERTRELGVMDAAGNELGTPATVTWHNVNDRSQTVRVDDVYRVYVRRFDVVGTALEFHGSLNRADTGFVRAGERSQAIAASAHDVAARIAATLADAEALDAVSDTHAAHNDSDHDEQSSAHAAATVNAVSDADDDFFASQAAEAEADLASNRSPHKARKRVRHKDKSARKAKQHRSGDKKPDKGKHKEHKSGDKKKRKKKGKSDSDGSSGEVQQQKKARKDA